MVTNLDYIAYPLPEDIERLVLGGDLARARRVIDARIASAKTPDCLRERLEFEKKILDEIPRTYALSEADLLQGLQARYEGFTREEMERLRDEGTLDWAAFLAAAERTEFGGSLMLEACWPVDWDKLNEPDYEYEEPPIPPEEYLARARKSCGRILGERTED